MSAAAENAITVDMAVGGSTTAIIHRVAMAGRAGVELPLERFDALSRSTPTLVNLKPSGKYLMEDFYYAGGLRALLRQIGDLLDLDCPTVNGRTLGENIANAEVFNDEVIRSRNNPLSPTGGTAVLRGNLAPDGAIIKPTAAEAHLHKHTGPAVVFENVDEMYVRIDDPDLDVTAESVLVLKNAGPLGGPGMPEWGQLPIPKKLLAQGVRDMVRISDCRMSGTLRGVRAARCTRSCRWWTVSTRANWRPDHSRCRRAAVVHGRLRRRASKTQSGVDGTAAALSTWLWLAVSALRYSS